MTTKDYDKNEVIHDVIIIGAGPCGLAVAARLREQTPSALFTDAEHQRYHWIKKHNGKMSVKNDRSGSVTPARSVSQSSKALSVVVLDASGSSWMSRWNRLFKVYGITHLRSPMFFHIDPSDRDSLLAMSCQEGMENELEELQGCVGKELSKHRKKHKKIGYKSWRATDPIIDERDRKDYFTPSQSLFSHHCNCVAARYDLDEKMIEEEDVEDISYDWKPEMSSSEKIFTVTTSHSVQYARVVVLAIGPANSPRPPLRDIKVGSPGHCHSMHITCIPHSDVARKIKAGKMTNVLIVGGGLTSAQIADLAIQRGVGKVWLLMRGQVKVKYFDFDLAWAGKYRNVEKAAFWSADSDEERLSLLQKARNGGSINPKFYKITKNHISSKRLALHTDTILSSASYNEPEKIWTVTTNTPIPEMPHFDYIYWATGITTDFNDVPCLKTMCRCFPIPGQGGLPCISDDLMWNDAIPLYLTGRLASLRLGPSAPNLEGARVGAERIAWSINERLDRGFFEDSDCFKLGLGNRYSALKTSHLF